MFKFILNLYLVFTKFLFCLIYCPSVVKFSVLIYHVCYINVVLEFYLNLYINCFVYIFCLNCAEYAINCSGFFISHLCLNLYIVISLHFI